MRARSTVCVLALIAAVAAVSVAASGAEAGLMGPKPGRQRAGKAHRRGRRRSSGGPCGTGLSECVPIPAEKNANLTYPTPADQNRMFGAPGCAYTPQCKPSGNAKVRGNLATVQITPHFAMKGQRPFVEALKRAFDAMKASGIPDAVAAYDEAKSNGAQCCRCIAKSVGGKKTCKRAGAWSNHSWGLAADFYFGAAADPRGDGKCQKGLAVMMPFLNAQKLYWAGGYTGDNEDSMHFEASNEVLAEWKAAGLLKI